MDRVYDCALANPPMNLLSDAVDEDGLPIGLPTIVGNATAPYLDLSLTESQLLQQQLALTLLGLSLNAGPNCGIGAGGFQPGNKCATGGGGETVAYHGSHSSGIKEFIPREVKDYNSIGTWFTGDSNKALSLYGPNVSKVAIPKNLNLVEFTQPDQSDFLRVLGGNYLIARKVGKLQEAKALEKRMPDEKYEKDYEKAVREERLHSEISQKFPDISAVKASNKAARSLLMDKKYIQEFRSFLEQAGKDGIVWRGSNIDTKKGDSPHDVYVLFHKQSLPVSQ
ncbi:hypothetical protein M0R72_16225 [Candidatus Pacearchaeota archaeon]|jgi:hypothetical protein|nr:hypothetical protein [Candidatus Pacearchaeota archaeon]